MRGVVLLLAAGEGVRLAGGTPKAFTMLDGAPLLRRAAEGASAAQLVDRLVVAVPRGMEERSLGVLTGLDADVRVVAGGSIRQGSAAAALAAAGEPTAVAVHDAARALCPPRLFDACLRELDAHEAVCPALPISDTVKEVDEDIIVRSLDRSRLAAAQTPQAFHTDVYRRAHEAAARDGVVATDDAGLVERLGVGVRIIPGDVENFKITTQYDLMVAEALLRTER